MIVQLYFIGFTLNPASVSSKSPQWRSWEAPSRNTALKLWDTIGNNTQFMCRLATTLSNVRWGSSFDHGLSVVLYDNGSSRIGLNIHKYVANLVSSCFKILERKVISECFFLFGSFNSRLSLSGVSSNCTYLFDFHMDCSLFPWFSALNIELQAHMFQSVLYVFNVTKNSNTKQKPQPPSKNTDYMLVKTSNWNLLRGVAYLFCKKVYSGGVLMLPWVPSLLLLSSFTVSA